MPPTASTCHSVLDLTRRAMGQVYGSSATWLALPNHILLFSLLTTSPSCAFFGLHLCLSASLISYFRVWEEGGRRATLSYSLMNQTFFEDMDC